MSFSRIVPLLACLIAVAVFPASAQVSASLFDLSLDGEAIAGQPWPVDSFYGVRLMGNGTSWGEVNTAEGVYNWTNLDLWLAATDSHSTDALYTFINVPQWASSNPTDPICRLGPGTCDPPNDLNANGTGPDQHWKDFVTALVNYNQSSTTGHIYYWEMWNEAHNNFFWNGTYAQLVRMVSDAYAIIKSADPQAVILSPTLGWQGQSLTWASGYLAAGGAAYVNAAAIHGYVFEYQLPGPVKTDYPETLVTLLPAYQSMLHTYGLGSAPIIDTEASWSENGLWGRYSTDPDLQAGFVARFYLLHAAYGIARLYWFEWNDPTDGTLWLPDPNDPSAPGTVQKAGIAYQQVYNWLVGNYISSGCAQVGTVWACGITGANGYTAQAVWDTSQTCSNGTCTTSPYQVNPIFTNYRTIYGSKISIKSKDVPIGALPILLANQ